MILSNVLLVLAMVTGLWLVSVRLRDASIIDPWWSMLMLAVTLDTARRAPVDAHTALVVGAVTLWAVRLWAHLLRRSRGKPEDPRYAAFRARYGPERYWWISYGQVFLLQGALALVVSAPLQVTVAHRRPLGLFDAVGAALFLVGFTVEAVADAQLQRFRDDPAQRGKVLDTGLWRWSRHPNYFGEAVLWWGFGAFALADPWGVPALIGPALMTWLLVRVSGVTMLDRHLLATRPGYADYLARTPGFWPRRPRRPDAR